MQLKKQSIRKSPDLHPIYAPRGINRKPADFNQVNNNQQRNRNAHGDSFTQKPIK